MIELSDAHMSYSTDMIMRAISVELSAFQSHLRSPTRRLKKQDLEELVVCIVMRTDLLIATAKQEDLSLDLNLKDKILGQIHFIQRHKKFKHKTGSLKHVKIHLVDCLNDLEKNIRSL